MQDQSTQNPASSSNPQGSVPVQADQNSSLQPQSGLQAPVSAQPQQDVLNNPNQKTVTVQPDSLASPTTAVRKSQVGLMIFIILAAIVFGVAVWRLLSRFEAKQLQTAPVKKPKDTEANEPLETVAETPAKPLPIMRSSTLNAPFKKPTKNTKKKKYNTRKHR